MTPIPNVAEVLPDWSLSIQFRLLVKSISDYEIVETPATDVVFRGILQPISPQLLSIKPEGQRKHKYWTLWTNKELEIDSKIIDFNSDVYRVMSLRDWSKSGYYEYDLIEDEAHS